jgi:hypothetical protein
MKVLVTRENLYVGTPTGWVAFSSDWLWGQKQSLGLKWFENEMQTASTDFIHTEEAEIPGDAIEMTLDEWWKQDENN